MAARPSVACTLALLLASTAAWPADAAAPATNSTTAAAPRHDTPFATVGEMVISAADYQRALAVAMRKKYYHAKPPEAELAKFQREVGDDVVNRVLLLKEAQRRGIQPDRDKINAAVAGYDAQYKGSANWSTNRDKMLAAVVPQLERESLFERLEHLVKGVPKPSDAVARGYYDKHPDLFVEPEQVRLSVILLKVDPSSPQALWNSAHEEARKLHQRLRGGADFAELARLHSADRSAEKGGQMDYTHRGMLPEAVHAVVDKLKPKGISEPVQLLEGITILRLDDRRASRQRPFDEVKERAADLWRRAEGDARWQRLINELRRNTPIKIDESHFGAPRGPTEKGRAG